MRSSFEKEYFYCYRGAIHFLLKINNLILFGTHWLADEFSMQTAHIQRQRRQRQSRDLNYIDLHRT
jgi:hypothetical protein